MSQIGMDAIIFLRFIRMLRNMFLGKPPGNYDRILDFSTAVTGCLFFVPTATFLENGPSATPDPPAPPPASAPAPSGSLNIGSLREQR